MAREPGRQTNFRKAEWSCAIASKGFARGASDRKTVAKSRSDGKTGNPSDLATPKVIETSGALAAVEGDPVTRPWPHQSGATLARLTVSSFRQASAGW